jgi:transposase-like protein
LPLQLGENSITCVALPTIDGSDANEAAIKRYNEEHGTHITIRQVKYLNNIVEQDHRGVKRALPQ